MGRTGPAFLAYANFAAYTRVEQLADLFRHRRLSRDPHRERSAMPACRRGHELPFNEVKNCNNCWCARASTSARSTACSAAKPHDQIEAMQIKYGLPAVQPTAELLARMRGGPRAEAAPAGAAARRNDAVTTTAAPLLPASGAGDRGTGHGSGLAVVFHPARPHFESSSLSLNATRASHVLL